MENAYINYPIINGVYNHYKGGVYRVLFLSTHTETKEVLVNYQSLLFGSYHSRPIDSWNKKVDSYSQDRFTFKEIYNGRS